MNEKFTANQNQANVEIADKLRQVAGQTNAGAYFITELENKLKEAHKPKTSWSMPAFKKIIPSFGWMVLVIVFGLVLSWSIRNLIPKPQPGANVTLTITAPNITPTPIAANKLAPTPVPSNYSSYDFRGRKLYLKQALPDSPKQAGIYQLQKDQQVTADEARALANRFGIQSETYTTYDYVFSVNDYYFTDGKQALQVYSNRRFTYTADLSKTSHSIQHTYTGNAESAISDFLKSHGFDFSIKVTTIDFFDGYNYSVEPRAPDNLPMQYESFTFPPMLIQLDENGNILSLDATLIEFDPKPVGAYGIITAQDALDKLLNDNEQAGKTEFSSSSSASGQRPKEWFRAYPDNQIITKYGYVSSYPAIDSSKPPFITIDGVPAIGNTSGMEKLDRAVRAAFVEAAGQYLIENGIRKFNVNTWNKSGEPADLSGSLRRDGDQIIFKADDGSGTEYPLIDPPADLPVDAPIPDSQLFITGMIANGKMDWIYIQYFEHMLGGGGGGGGGLGFYKLNLSGTPVPFPSPTSIPAASAGGDYTVQAGDTVASIANRFGISANELGKANNLSELNLIIIGQKLIIPGYQAPTEQKVQDLRGYLYASIHIKSDGTSSKEYTLEVAQDSGGSAIYTLAGSVLGELDAYNALPILVTGTIDTTGKLVVDSYKIPYPDLHFQILKGVQKSEQIDGQMVTVFTTQEGKSYVEFLVTNNIPNTTSVTGVQGDQIEQEALIFPDESFGGMPVVHIYQSSMIQANGTEMQVEANKIRIFNDLNDPNSIPSSTPPNLTIDQAELVYFVNNPYYQVSDPNYSQRSPYLQPVWHFHGHYDNGDIYDVMIQALKPEYLKPEIAPGIGPG